MNRTLRSLAMSIVAVHAFSMAGCSSDIASAPNHYEPAKAAEVAMRTYDVNQDGLLDAVELEKCPALQGALVHLDRDRDRSISSSEIADRMEAYKAQSKLVYSSVLVLSGRKPVSGASVTFELEPFMGEDLTRYSGTTDEHGRMEIMTEGSGALPGLLPSGFYRVRLSPNGGNATEVILGCEVADDTPSSRQLIFSLDSKIRSDGGARRSSRRRP